MSSRDLVVLDPPVDAHQRLPARPIMLDLAARVATSHGDLRCQLRTRFAPSGRSKAALPEEDWLKRTCLPVVRAELQGLGRSALLLRFGVVARKLHACLATAVGEAGLALLGLEVGSIVGCEVDPREVRVGLRFEVLTATFPVVATAKAALRPPAGSGAPEPAGEAARALQEHARRIFEGMDAAAVHRRRDTWHPDLERAVTADLALAGHELSSLRVDLEQPAAGLDDRIILSVSDLAVLDDPRTPVSASARAELTLGDPAQHRAAAVTDVEAWAERALGRALAATLAGLPLEPERAHADLHRRFSAELGPIGYQPSFVDLDLKRGPIGEPPSFADLDRQHDPRAGVEAPKILDAPRSGPAAARSPGGEAAAPPGIEPSVSARVERFVGEQVTLTVPLTATAERTAVTFSGRLKLTGVTASPGREPDLDQLAADLVERLQSLLKRESSDLLLARSRAAELEEKVRGFVHELVPRSFGLRASLENWDRAPTDVEVTKAQLGQDELASAQRALKAISDQIERAWVEGTPEEIAELKARRRRVIEHLGGLQSAPGPDATVPLARPRRALRLAMAEPHQGYPTAHPDCRVSMDVRVSLQVPVEGLDDPARLQRDISEAIDRVMRETDPGDLHLRFEHSRDGKASPADRLRKAIAGVIEGRPEALLDSVELAVSPSLHQERFRRLKGQPLELNEIKVPVPGRQLPVVLSATVVVEDVLPGGWARFEGQEIGAPGVLHRAGQIFADHLRGGADPGALDRDEVQALLTRELGPLLGLDVRVIRIQARHSYDPWRQNEKELEILLGRLAEINVKLTKLASATGKTSEEMRAGLLRERDDLEARRRLLTGERGPAASAP